MYGLLDYIPNERSELNTHQYRSTYSTAVNKVSGYYAATIGNIFTNSGVVRGVGGRP
jgi:hypothetical protein